MKFVHIADLHIDSPFVNLSDKDTLGEIRRLDQRKAIKKVVEYIKENNIPYLFISGDLYEHKYIKKSTIQYINNLFKEIPNTSIFISPGNHDPYLQNSYYIQFKWNDNVHIFKSKIEKIELENVNIYGYGFDNFYCTNSNIENIELDDKNKINILVIHGTLNGASIEEKQYNSIPRKLLEEKGFDYIAVGHIHKLDYNTYENQKIVYPGSTISLGFDELGTHGMIVGELNNGLKLKFVPLDDEEFVKRKLSVDNMYSKEELIESINEMNINSNEYVEIILTGRRNFEINIYELQKFLQNNRIIKVKDETKISLDLEKIANENTLRGLFVKEMMERLEKETNSEERDILERAIEIGLNALE